MQSFVQLHQNFVRQLLKTFLTSCIFLFYSSFFIYTNWKIELNTSLIFSRKFKKAFISIHLCTWVYISERTWVHTRRREQGQDPVHCSLDKTCSNLPLVNRYSYHFFWLELNRHPKRLIVLTCLLTLTGFNEAFPRFLWSTINIHIYQK